MTTIADLLTSSAADLAGGSQTGDALEAFMRKFDPGLADAMEHEIRHDKEFMSRVDCAIILYAVEDEEFPHWLGRLRFDGRPFALLRFDGSRGSEDKGRWTVRLTHRGVAERLAQAVQARLRQNGERLTEAAAGDDAGDLLDFGPTAELDMTRRALRFRETTRLLMLADRRPRAVLFAVEGGGFLIGSPSGEPKLGAFEAEDFNHRLIREPEPAAAAFTEVLRNLVGCFRPEARRPDILILHANDGRTSVGLVSASDGMKCSTTSKAGGGVIDAAAGDESVPAFLRICGDLVQEAVAPYRAAASAPR